MQNNIYLACGTVKRAEQNAKRQNVLEGLPSH